MDDPAWPMPNMSDHLLEQYMLGTLPTKKNGIIWEFFPSVGPPPFWEPLFPKKKCGLFCILGHLEHFWSSQKCSLFGNYSDIYFWDPFFLIRRKSTLCAKASPVGEGSGFLASPPQAVSSQIPLCQHSSPKLQPLAPSDFVRSTFSFS